MKNAFDVVRDFEQALCEYTGAPYAVTTNSCTKALGLCFEYLKGKNPEISMPKYTYVGVAMQAKRLGYKINFTDVEWVGAYACNIRDMNGIKVWDAARRFTFNMYEMLNKENDFMCLSFHYTKILSISQGGAILHNNLHFDQWARKVRFDGRWEKGSARDLEQYDVLGDHCYMGPEVAAIGLRKLNSMNKYNEDLPTDNYPDLSQIELFK